MKDILVKAGDFIPVGWYFRSWTGRIMRVHTKGQKIEQESKWFKYASPKIEDLIFVGDILRLRDPGHTGDRGVLVEVEELDEVEYYLEHNELLQVMTFDRSAKSTLWVVCYENPLLDKVGWLGDGTNGEHL